MAYLMESSDEAERLEQKTDAGKVRQRLELVGLRPGMRCLDAGAGTGAIARLMAEMVGKSGSVVAFDASADRLAHGAKLAQEAGLANFSTRVGDLYDPKLEPGSFDFVWSEFVFEYLSDPDRVLANLVELVAPKGKLVVGDLDGNGIFHDPVPDGFEADLAKFIAALQGSFDPHAGRQLYGRFVRAGLRDPKVHVMPYHLYPGTMPAHERSNWETKFKTLRPRGVVAFGNDAAYDRFVATYLKLLDDPGTLNYSVLFYVEWTKPAA